jgi:hypothetical protein
MMMIDIFSECPPQRSFSKQNKFGPAFLLNRTHPSLSESVQVRAALEAIFRLTTARLKGGRELRSTIMEQGLGDAPEESDFRQLNIRPEAGVSD